MKAAEGALPPAAPPGRSGYPEVPPGRSGYPEAPPGRSGYLMVRRDGGVWGIANAAVTSLARQAGSSRGAYRVGTEGEPLAADEILGVAADLEVHAPARAVERWWPAGSDGCALWGGLPVAMVDPSRPPLALRMAAEEGTERAAGAAAEEPGGEPNGD